MSGQMDVPPRILLLENDSAAARSIEQTLAEARLTCEMIRVDEPGFTSALLQRPVEVVVLGPTLPKHQRLFALDRLREHQPHTGVILILDSLSRDEEVESLTAGPVDYVFEDRLQRLVPSIVRVTRQTSERREFLQAQAALQASEHRLTLALEASEVSVWEYDITSGEVRFSRHLGPMLGYSESEVPLRIDAWEALTHPEDVSAVKTAMVRHFRGESPIIDVEYRIRAKSGEWRWLHTVGRAVARDARGRGTLLSGTHRDVTERRRSDEMLRLLRLATDAATNAIVIVDARAHDYPIVHVNRAFETVTQYSVHEALGRNCRFLQGEDRDQPEIERLRTAIASGTEASVLLRNYRKDGTLFWNNLQISPLRNGSGAVSHFVGIQNDVTELKNYQSELEYRATHDALTGLANRAVLHDTIDRLIAHAARSGENFVLLFLDLDRFKLVNDSLGHASGDRLLICVGDRLNTCVRQSDIVARLGGDEFAVVLPDNASAESAASVARKILHAIGQPITALSQEVVTSASIGACVYPGDGENAEVLLKNADIAMYRAKRSGGSQVCFYTEDLNRNAIDRLRLEAALSRALSFDQFELHYQPRVHLRSARVTSVEALIRWRRDEDELILPGRFIPLAEETGLIVPLGIWILRAACRQMRRWRDAGHEHMRVAVNLSARQLLEPDLVDSISSILAETGVEARHLELEITESIAMDDPDKTQRLLKALSDLGVALSIDDFGTGHSSLAYLKRFHIDYLKIDQSFVRGLMTDENDANIVRSIIALGKNLQIAVIAEGVEDEQQRVFLDKEACDEMQGFLYSMPKPACELAFTTQA